MRKETIKKLNEFNVIDLYQSGKTIIEISKITNCGSTTISNFLKENNVEIRKAAKRDTLRELPIIGDKFGQWTVISSEIKSGTELKESDDRSLYWRVQCKCGESSWRLATHLKNGKTNACKACARRGDIHNFIYSKFNITEKGLKTRKKVGNLDFNITPEYLDELYNRNHFCVYTGIDLSYDNNLNVKDNPLSIDRIDSNVGYVEGNIQFVHKNINMMKGILTHDDFINFCKMVANKYSE
jgi:hypothetical protein